MKLRVINANGLRFTCYHHGHGPKCLILLHGFPDDAASWLGMMAQLDEAQYTMIAPYMRGYGPTSKSHDGLYMPVDLAQDIEALMDAFDFETCTLIGHDWGAVAAYAATNAMTHRIDQLIALSMPPPLIFLKRALTHPEQLKKSAYIALFQIPGLSDWLLSRNNFAMVETLWQQWSPTWQYPSTRLAKVKTTLNYRHSTRSVLKYYRGLLIDSMLEPKKWKQSIELMLSPIQVPTLVISGDQDQCILPSSFHKMNDAFDAPWQHIQLEHCGHFPQHEAPDMLLTLIQKALVRSETT